jgi:hypothetical protein
MQVQINPLGPQLLEEADQILEAPTEPIDGPDRHQVKLSPDYPLHHPPHGRPVLPAPGSADAFVLEHFDYLPAVALGGSLQLAALVRYRLFNGLARASSEGFIGQPLPGITTSITEHLRSADIALYR